MTKIEFLNGIDYSAKKMLLEKIMDELADCPKDFEQHATVVIERLSKFGVFNKYKVRQMAEAQQP